MIAKRERVLASLVGVLALGLATAGCTPDGTPQSPTTVTETAGPVQVTLQVYGPPKVIAAYTTLAAQYSAGNPQVAINIRPYDDHDASMKAFEETPPGKHADLFLMSETDLDGLRADKMVQPVDQLLVERGVEFGDGFERAGLETFSADNRLQCMPTQVSPMVVYLNLSLVRLRRIAAPGDDPPSAADGWNFEEFTRGARQAARRAGRGVYLEPSLEYVAPFLLGAGGTLVDDPTAPTTLTLGEDPDLAGLRQLLDVVRNPRLTYSRKQLSRRSALERFRAGRLGMIVGYRDLLPQLREAEDVPLGIMPMPSTGRRSTVARVQGMCLSAESKVKGPAADVLAYLTGPAASERLAQTGYTVPASVNALDSTGFLEPDGISADPAAFTGQFRYLRPRPEGASWQRLISGTRADFEQLFYKPVLGPLEERLATLDEQSQTLLNPQPESPEGTESPSASASAG